MSSSQPQLDRCSVASEEIRLATYRRPAPGGARIPRRQLAFQQGKVLFLASFSQHLDTAQLLKRFAFDAEVISLCDNNKTGVDRFGTPGIYWPEYSLSASGVLENIRRVLRDKPVVIVCGPYPLLEDYPPDILRQFRELVSEGTVFAHMNSTEATEDFFDGDDLAHGRLITLQNGADAGRGYLDGNSSLEADYDRSLRDVAKMLVSPHASYRPLIRDIQFQGSRIVVNCTGDEQFELHLTIFRKHDCALVASETWPAESGITIELAGFPEDGYYAIAEIIGLDGRLCDWATITFQVGAAAATVLELDSGTVRPGESMSFRMQGEQPDGMTYRWTDIYGRLLSEGPLDADQSLTVPMNSLSVLNYLEFELSFAGKPSRILYRDVLMPGNATIQDYGFRFFVWNICDSFSWRDKHYFDALKETVLADGLCNCALGRDTALQAARSGLSTIPYSAWFHKIGLDDCLFNDDWLEQTRQRVLDAVRNHRDFGAAGYTLGDECYIDAFTKGGRFSSSEHVWAQFRDYLRAMYGALDELNSQWDTQFNSWEAVKKESDAELLTSFDNPSAWTDFRMFTAHAFARTFRELRELIRREDPGALVGWDGCEQYSSYDGIDWWDFTRDMDINVVYAGSTLGCSAGYGNRTFNSQAVKSFNREAPISGAFLNDINAACGPEYSPWLLLLHGYNSMWWWHASYPQPEYGALNWDLSCTPVMQGLAATMRELRGGIAAMLGQATTVTSPIAMHYSANNFHASTLESGVGNHINNLGISKAEFWMAERVTGRTISADDELMEMFGTHPPAGHYAPAFKNFLLLFKDMGFQPLTVSRQQIEGGSLLAEGFKVLVLPFTVSLSDSEAERIAEFVESGGLVIADYHCGLRDLHGKQRPVPALDDVFGITHKQTEVLRQPAKVDVEYGFSRGGRWDVVFRDDIEIRGSGCVLKAYDDGTPMPNDGTSVYGCHEDGSPAFIVNAYGKGKALFLNFDLYSYSSLRRLGDTADTVDTFRFLLWSLAGLRNDLVPKDLTGALARAVETVRFSDGPIDFYGLLPDFAVNDKRPATCSLDFPDDCHIYDVRQQKRLGNGRQIVTLSPGKPVLLAQLPVEIIAVRLAVNERGGPDEVFEFQVRIETSLLGDFPFTARIEFMTPDGSVNDLYTRLVQTREDGGRAVWSPALNDQKGIWQIKVTELISGLTASRNVVIS